MTEYWAIAVGINHYQRLQPLHFAQPDAQSLCESLVSDAGFLPEHCILVTDTSAEFAGHSTDPTRENLLNWSRFLTEKLQPEDSLWYFFSGYGICVDGDDYLLPIDADPDQVAETGISVRSLFQTLKSLPTQNTLVLLDINRAQSVTSEKVGAHATRLAAESEIPLILSCRPEQFSYESSAHSHGLFTQALLEGLRSHQCSTLAGLEEFLTSRLPELSEHSDRPVQDPILIVSEPEQLYQVMMPVNWAETDTWTPVELNPFAIEDDLYLSATDPDQALYYDTYEPTQPIMGATATETLPIDPEPPTDPELPIDPVPPEPEMPDQMFWERLLFGGSAILLVLLLGVLFRNWSAFMGSQQPAKAPASPVAVVPNSPAQVPPKNSEQILNEARSYIKPTLASDASRAIERARAVPQSDPLYAQAQKDIDRWSGNILEIAKKRAEQKEFQQAIAAAQLVPKDRPQYTDAQKAIQQWKKASR